MIYWYETTCKSLIYRWHLKTKITLINKYSNYEVLLEFWSLKLSLNIASKMVIWFLQFATYHGIYALWPFETVQFVTDTWCFIWTLTQIGQNAHFFLPFFLFLFLVCFMLCVLPVWHNHLQKNLNGNPKCFAMVKNYIDMLLLRY